MFECIVAGEAFVLIAFAVGLLAGAVIKDFTNPEGKP